MPGKKHEKLSCKDSICKDCLCIWPPYICTAKKEVLQVALFLMIDLLLASLNLTSSGNVKINPGPTYTVKNMPGSLHQVNPRFGYTAEI